MTVVQVEPPLPTGTEIRRWTRRSGRRNVAAGFTDVFGDLYMVGVAVLMTSATVYSLAGRLAPGDAVAAPDTAATSVQVFPSSLERSNDARCGPWPPGTGCDDT